MLRSLLVRAELARPHNMLAAAFGAVAGYYIAGGREPAHIAGVAVLTAAVTGTGNMINDFYDAPIDRINKPRRPIPSRRLSSSTVMTTYVVLTAVIAIAAPLLVPMDACALIWAWQVALFAYAWRVKRVFIVGNLLVAAVSASAFVAGAMLAGATHAAWVPVAIAFLFVLSRELVKGAEDVEGDRDAGVRTVAVVAGVEATVLWAATLMLALAVLIPLPTLLAHYGRAYFWVMETLVVPGLVIGACLILQRPTRHRFSGVSWLLKIEMFFGILAVGLGRI